MMTTGTKLFLGASLLAIVGAVAYGVTQGGELGTLGLASAAVALVFMTGIVVFVRDCTVSSMDTEGIPDCNAARTMPGNSMWPMVAAAALGLLAIGVVTNEIVFTLGLVALFAAALEWMVQAWSERASADATHNAAIRGRVLHPLEFPVLAAVGLAVIVVSFSRIMLALTPEGGPVVFGLLAAMLLAGGFLFAVRPAVRRTLVTSVCAVATVGLIAAGVAGGVSGERELERHETTEDLATAGECLTNEPTHADENASTGLSAKSDLHARVVLRDGQLWAETSGLDGRLSTITLALGTASNIVFENADDHAARLVVDLGVVPAVDEQGNPVADRTVPAISCTALAEEGDVQFITVVPTRASRGADEPFTLSVPDVEATIEIVVPS